MRPYAERPTFTSYQSPRSVETKGGGMLPICSNDSASLFTGPNRRLALLPQCRPDRKASTAAAAAAYTTPA
jgi:hypothetical protein